MLRSRTMTDLPCGSRSKCQLELLTFAEIGRIISLKGKAAPDEERHEIFRNVIRAAGWVHGRIWKSLVVRSQGLSLARALSAGCAAPSGVSARTSGLAARAGCCAVPRADRRSLLFAADYLFGTAVAGAPTQSRSHRGRASAGR